LIFSFYNNPVFRADFSVLFEKEIIWSPQTYWLLCCVIAFFFTFCLQFTTVSAAPPHSLLMLAVKLLCNFN
jgi:hypothetical protein